MSGAPLAGAGCAAVSADDLLVGETSVVAAQPTAILLTDALATDAPVTAENLGEEPAGPFSGPIAGDPVVTLELQLPPVAATSTDVPLVFSIAGMNPIQVGAGFAVPDQVTLSVTDGTLTLAGREGIELTVGDGIDDATIGFSGDRDAVNAALDGLRYVPADGFAGRATLVVEVSGAEAMRRELRIAVNAALDADAARDQILAGVSVIHSGGQPGRMVAYGPQAYGIADYPGDADEGPMIAAASWGAGRVVAVPDHQMLNMGSYGDISGTFYRNALAWLTETTRTDIKIVTYASETAGWLTGQGYTRVTVTSEAGLATALRGADVFVGWLGSSERQSNLDALTDFASAGGGLMIQDYGVGYDWWWGKPIDQAPGNLLLREPGIGFASGNRWDTGTIDATNRTVGQINAAVIIDMLHDSSGYTTDQLAEGGASLGRLYDVLPAGDPLLAQLDSVFWTRIDQINPTPATPVSDPFDQALLEREADILKNTPADQVTAHRTAAAVYGAIPAAAPRVTQTVTLDTSRGRWHATGLYAAPGELVTITLPASFVGKGYKIRVNAHKDSISGRSSWERAPYVHRSFTIDSTTVQVANAFGGSIFIDFGGGNAYATPPNLGPVDITIAGAVEQPYFVLGQHTDQQWVDALSDRPAPYAVLVSDNLIFVQRASESATLNQPTALMTWWNDVVALEDRLASRRDPRTSAEVINVDVQQSAGAAHSGYPIQAYDKYWGNLADFDRLTVEGSWGNFHELGHNHQRGWWTFSGDGEVTVNIFSTYALRQQASAPTGGWSWTTDPAAVMERAQEAVRSSSTYAGIDSVSDRLAFWVQLADGFGWDRYADVLRGYEDDNALRPGNLPDNNQEEKDQWLVRWSNAVGYDMTAFMVDTWGLSVSQSAIDSVRDLPDWMPLVVQNDTLLVTQSESGTINPLDNDLAMDGVIDMIGFTQPEHGQLVDQADGTLTYVPDAGFRGTDSFEYTVASSQGNTRTGSVAIAVVDWVTATGPTDTYLLESAPNAANGTAGRLKVDGSYNGGAAQALLRFDRLFGSDGAQIPAGAVIERATLQLQVTNAGSPLRLHRMLGPWQDTATWNSLTGGVEADDIEALRAADVTTGSIGTGRVSIDVTASIQAWANDPSANFGWAILPTGTNGVDFHSAQGAQPPRLVVAYRSDQPVAGDVNLDGTVNGLDVDPFVDRLLNGPYQTQADMNGDGLINGLDVDPFVAMVVGG